MRPRGFTLVETIIYVALFAAMMGILSSVFVSSLRTNELTRQNEEQLAVRRLVETRIREAAAQSNAIQIPASGSSGQLTLQSPAFSGNTASFFLSSGTLYLQEGTSAAVALTPSTVDVTSFSATRLPGSPPGVEISTGVSSNAPGIASSFNSDFTVILRYE